MNSFRKSFYSIVVPLDEQSGEFMLIHGFTGAIDIVSKEIGAFFSNKEELEIKDLECSDGVLKNLINRGFITEKTKDEEIQLVHKMTNAIHLYQKQESKKFYFLINYNCNFRCPYCYENLISNKGKNWSNQIMTRETVDAAFNCLFEIEPLQEKHSKEIVLYGGEPLMADNFEIVNYIVDKGVSLGYCFSAITNGYDLNIFSELLEETKIRKIQITLDGDKSYHNKRRFHYQKGASYDKIITNVQNALGKNIKVQIRSNIDSNNIDSVRNLIDEFKRLGFLDNPNFSFYPAMLKNNPNNILDTTKYKSINYLESADFENINDEFKNNTGAYSKLILSALKSNKPLQLRPTFCGAQNCIYILDSYRNIYCCLESVGISHHIIGDFEQGLQWNDNFPIWKGRNTATISACSNCQYALICGGGCCAKVMHVGIKEPYCNQFPEVFRANVRRAYNVFIN